MTTALDREPGSIVVTRSDLWAIQKAVKFHTFMLDDRTYPRQPIFPQTIRLYPGGEKVGVHTAYKLREKLNRYLLRLYDENLAALNMPIDYDEAWYIDWCLNAETYQGDANDPVDVHGMRGAKRLLLEVFRVIYEYENGERIEATAVGDGQDQSFDPSLFEAWKAHQGGGSETTAI